MSYRTCLACLEVGTKPEPGAGVTVVYDPGIQMPGTPTLAGHRLSAAQVATIAYNSGLQDVMEGYDLSREEVLVACWWAGRFGPRKLRRIYGAWATIADRHLWYGCIRIADPPTEERLP